MHTEAHGHVTAEEEGRDQLGEGGKRASSFIEKCPDSCISYKIKINFLNEINFKKFLPCWFGGLNYTSICIENVQFIF